MATLQDLRPCKIQHLRSLSKPFVPAEQGTRDIASRCGAVGAWGRLVDEQADTVGRPERAGRGERSGVGRAGGRPTT